MYSNIMRVISVFYLTGICVILAIDDPFIFQSKMDSVDFLGGQYLNTNLEEGHGSLYLRDIESGSQSDETTQQDNTCRPVKTKVKTNRKLIRLSLYRTRAPPPPPPPACTYSPCSNGATCTNVGNSYSCACSAGYTGTQCTSDIDECNSSPCQNDATCNNLVNSFTCTCGEDYIGTVCETDTCYPTGGADVAIILDGSTSQGQARFESQKDFIKTFISAFPIGAADFRFSVVSASTAETVHFGLNTHLTNTSLLQAVDDIQFTGGASKVHLAMDAVRNQVFNGVTKPKYLITLHDGMVSGLGDALSAVSLIKSTGVTMATVGFGDQILHQGLIAMATDYNHVFSPTTNDLIHWMNSKHAMAQCPDCSILSSDMFILLEASTDLGLDKFYELLNAMKTIVTRTPIHQNGVHVSYAHFTDTVTERYDFVTHYTSNDAITAAITTTLETRSSNYTNALKHVKDNVFTTTNGYRLGSRKIVILFISESITELSSVLEQADSLKSDNVTVVVVSVALATRLDISSLQQIVSDPAYLFILGDSIYGDFSTLYTLLSMFQYSECIFD